MNNYRTLRSLPVRIAAVCAAAAIAVLTVPLGWTAGTEAWASDNTMMTDAYNVDVVVAEDNTYDFHEHLDIDYITYHHGIYRYIPMQGVKLSKIKVPGYDYDTYNSSGYKVIKIGSADYTLIGRNSYDIYYHVMMYEDNNEEKDMLLVNLLPTDWETDIASAECTVTLPKAADLSKAEVFSGPYGTSGNEDGVKLETSDDGLTIRVTGSDIPAHHGVTVTLELPQGYWVGAAHFGDVGIVTILLFALGPIGAFLLWYAFGRDDHVVRTLEFYPPEGLTPGEIGYLADGRVDKRDIISNIVYMADRGYITIEQKDRKKFIFHAVLEPGNDEPAYIRTLYAGLFPNGGMTKSSDKLGVAFGKKYQKAMEQLNNMYTGKKEIIKSESRLARVCAALCSLLPIAAFCTWQMANGDDDGWIGIGWAGFHVLLATWLMCSTYDNIRASSKVKSVLKTVAAIWFFAVGILILPVSSDAMTYVDSKKGMALVLVLIITVLACMFLSVIAIARTDRYTQLLGKVLGFRDFIRTAELDKINELVEEDPEYFYHILPYAYVFGLTNKWIKNFESLPIVIPEWYVNRYRGFDAFDYYMMGRMFSDCSASVNNNIVIPAPAGGGHSGGFSGGGGGWSGGGGFSGGGFSGGGIGGGGGGGW